MKDKKQPPTFLHLRGLFLTRKFSLLLIGFLLLVLSDMRGSAGLFAWFLPVPFLIYVALYKGVKNHVWLFLFLLAGTILSFIKAISNPLFISIGFSIMIGFIIAIRYYLTFIIWSYVRRWAGELISIIAFPAILISMEYLQAFYTPFGDWGSLANTQLYDLPLLQTASLFGFLGISAIMAWAAVLCASLILQGNFHKKSTQIIFFILALIAVYVYGDLRLNKVPEGKHITAAAITVNNQFTGEMPDPENPLVLQTTDTLLNKTVIAARRGASIAVWGEGSTVISEEKESLFIDRLSVLAKAHNIEIIAAYAVPLSKEEQTKEYNFLNKFTWVDEGGEIVETYLKHHPVPGEGSKPGTAPLKVVKTRYGNMAGAICYDYDFPQMSLTHAHLDADLVLVPGMDWRGMLMQHTLMARIRAIEGGFSLIRAATEATSMGFNNYGQVRAAMYDFGNNDRILLASLPVERVKTLYSMIGNLLAYIALITFAICIFITIRNFLHARKR